MSTTFEIVREIPTTVFTCSEKLSAPAFEQLQSTIVARQAEQIRQLRTLLVKSICDCVLGNTEHLGNGYTITTIEGHHRACKYRLVLEALGHV